jgi:opacity protein-like surface antigen
MLMHLMRTTLTTTALALTLVAAPSVQADDRWYVDVTGAITFLDVSSVDVDLDDGTFGTADLDSDTGFAFGGAFGREIDDRWRVEAELMYRTNDHEALTLPDGRVLTEGDYSSLIVSANGYYLFGDPSSAWRPFVGVGAGWIQEIDIDFEEAGVESSFSGDGFAWQAMAGVSWRASDRWSFDLEARYLGAGDIDMDGEEGPVGGRMTADYSLFSVAIGASVRF